ncbi:TPA: CRTAC1 family protein [Candidatus Poribacteria bacterium]|nr:CRTAC1 family protein [Candidatus Poribacteria bacterium]
MFYVSHIWLHSFLTFWIFSFPVSAQIRFTDVTSQSGIHFQHEDGRSGERYFLETLGAGVAWFDYDNDGDLDIYFVNGADLPGMSSSVPPTNALYRNNGDGTFTDVTEQAGVGDTNYGFSCAVGDYDNDGWDDLYVTNFGPNLLYHNNGDGTFTDVTQTAGVGDERWAAAAAFADYDNDGDIDLFVANYVDFKLENNPVCTKLGVRLHCSPDVFDGTQSILYRNNGDGTFTDVTQQAGMVNPNDKGMGVIWCDYDNDSDIDLFVANDRTPDRLYQNNGDSTFTEIALLSGIALSETGAAFSSMAPILGDIDNDGWFDLVVTNYNNEPNCVYKNDGDGFFSDITYQSGIGGYGLYYLSWGADFADFDNDGYIDLFIANGQLDENIEEIMLGLSYEEPNQLFRNRGDGTFEDVSNQSGEGLLLEKVSRSAAFGDYDNDGDIDILVTNSHQTPDLLRNDTINENNWLIFETVGVKSNRDGIGTRIKVVADGKSQIREVKSGGSYPSHSDMRLHFGLGKATVADLVEIRWPSGLVERFEGVKANRFLKAKEGEKLSEVVRE